MRDADVRAATLKQLRCEHEGDQDSRIVEEMGIWSGSVRVDVAVINGQLSGYELKSDKDNLDRLPYQSELYSKVFDRMHLIVGSRHAAKARRIIPRWWGVTVANCRKDEIFLEIAREAKPNPNPDALFIARLLWREEALAILDALELSRGWRSKSAPQIHDRLATVLPFSDLSYQVRSALKQRSGWLGQPISDQLKMSVNSDFDPCMPTT